MGTFIVEIRNPANDADRRLLVWSSRVDAPVTYGMTEAELTEYVRAELGESGVRDLPERLARVRDHGTSLPSTSWLHAISINRAGPNETCLMPAEIWHAFADPPQDEQPAHPTKETPEENELLGFTSDALRNELDRRTRANSEGLCDACGRWYDDAPCHNLRHDAASAQWLGRWHLDWGSTYLTARHATRADRALIAVSRYGTRVSLSRDTGDGRLYCCAETCCAENLNDRERFVWAVAWADEQLAVDDSPAGK